MRVRACIIGGIVTAAAGMAGTVAPAALADSPTPYCAVVGAAAPGPDVASPVLGQGCFTTKAAKDAFVQSTVAKTRPTASVSPNASLHLGVAWSGQNLSGNRYDFYGTSGACNGSTYYQFSNLNGPFSSAADDLASGANCENAYYWSGSNFNGRNWDCYATYNGSAYQSCGGSMPAGDNGAAHSVRFRQ